MSEPHDNHDFDQTNNKRASTRALSEMRLRPDRPPVTRLSRKVLLALGVVAAVGIAGASFFALAPHESVRRSELYNTANRSTPEGLSTLPRDYTGLPHAIPRLGPPLPGDLGKPMLNAGISPTGMPTVSAMTAEQQRVVQEQEAARNSHLFVSTNPITSSAAAASVISGQPAPASLNMPADPMPQDHKVAFLNGAIDRRPTSPDRVQSPATPYVLQTGAVIPASLITGLRSDLPGQVTAQVTENVYDSPTGRILLIPQGARILGEYDAQIGVGQSRALLVWNRLILPDGRSIVLERQPAADAEGYAGLEDKVDNHWGALFKAAILSTILSLGAEAGTSSSQDNLALAIRRGASESFNQAGEQVVGRSLSIPPTITIRPGFSVRVLVTHDLVLEPYAG